MLVRALGLIGALSIPALAIFGLVPALLLRLAFGADYESGDQVLFLLGVAFSCLACTYVTVQFLLGLHRRVFVLGLRGGGGRRAVPAGLRRQPARLRGPRARPAGRHRGRRSSRSAFVAGRYRSARA